MIHLALLIVSFAICSWAIVFTITLIGIILQSRTFWFLVATVLVVATLSNLVSQYR